jgi:hypothetical protein
MVWVEYDDILDQDFDALQNICVDIQVLRQTFPVPTEKEWGIVADRLVNLSMRKWAWLLESPRLVPPSIRSNKNNNHLP